MVLVRSKCSKSKKLSQSLLCENKFKLLERLLLTSLHSCFSGGLHSWTGTDQKRLPLAQAAPTHTCKRSTASLQILCQCKSYAQQIGQVAFIVFFHNGASAETCELRMKKDGWRWDGLMACRADRDRCPRKDIISCNFCSRS